jgi:hypothetical protein
MPDAIQIALVFVLVIGLGFGLWRLSPDPPNPVTTGSGFFARNFWANTWWGGAGLVLLAPVLGYLEGVGVGIALLVLGALCLALSGALLRE